MDQLIRFFESCSINSYPYLEPILVSLNYRRNEFNNLTKDYDNFYLVLITAILTTLVWSLYYKTTQWIQPDINDTYWSCIKRFGTQVVLKTPFLKDVANREIMKFFDSIKSELRAVYKNEPFQEILPENSKSASEVMKHVEKYLSLSSVKWEEGKVSGAIYCDLDDNEFLDLMASVYRKTAYTNPLHADVYPGIRKMEAEIVKITCHLFKGGPESCGVISTGGTESIILAVKAFCSYGRSVKGIKHPEIIIPITAHPAFDKAGELLKVKLRKINLDQKTKAVDLKAVKSAINSNTCMIVGSAPGYPYGVFDPIEKLAELGLKYDIPVHVDACLGGFLNPFVEEAGYNLSTKFDFTVTGVTSITADTHKYGYAPKGTSVVMYSHEKYREHQYFITTEWPGGLYACPTIPGSRPGGIIADCWAAIMYHGRKKYVDNAKKILDISKRFIKEIESIDGLYVLGKPELSVVAISSNDFNIFTLTDELSSKGWNLNALQFPSAFHVCFTMMHTKKGLLEKLVSDIKETTQKLMLNRDKSHIVKGQAALYGVSQSIPDRSLVSTFAKVYLNSYYSSHK